MSLWSLQASQELFQLQVTSAHLQDDGQQEHRLASQVDVCAAVKGLLQLPKRCPAGSSPEYPLRRRSFSVQDSQELLQETQQDSCLAEELPADSGGRGQSSAPDPAPSPRKGAGTRAGARPEEPNPPSSQLLGTLPLPSRRREGWGPPGQAGLPGRAGAACRPPRRGLPGAVQRAPGCSQSPPALAPGQRPRAAAEQRARAAPSSSSSCSLLLQRKTQQEPLNGDRQASALAACPALPCLQRGTERCGRTGREQAAATAAPAQWLQLGGS